MTGTVGKVKLILTFTTAVCRSWNMSDKYTWDNAGDLKQLSMDETLNEDNRQGSIQDFLFGGEVDPEKNF